MCEAHPIFWVGYFVSYLVELFVLPLSPPPGLP